MLCSVVVLRRRRDQPAGRAPTGRSRSGKQPQPEQDGEVTRQKMVVCASCGNPIAEPQAAISVDGSHDHTFVNPHGLVFKIRCFADTTRTIIGGEPTTDWSWFAGYAWQVESCGVCAEHLGWIFRATHDQFHGLIAARIAE